MELYQVVSIRDNELFYTNHLTKFKAIRERVETIHAFSLHPENVWVEREA